VADEQDHPDIEEMQLGVVLAALADPRRRAVVQCLIMKADERPRTCASFDLSVSKSSLTHHFRVLRQAGLIHQDDRGNRNEVTLRRAELEQRFPGLLELIAADASPAAAAR
jgi:DNA-binding transcriptional ArsR family regulator